MLDQAARALDSSTDRDDASDNPNHTGVYAPFGSPNDPDPQRDLVRKIVFQELNGREPDVNRWVDPNEWWRQAEPAERRHPGAARRRRTRRRLNTPG